MTDETNPGDRDEQRDVEAAALTATEGDPDDR